MEQCASPRSESCPVLMARNLNSGTQRNSVCFLGGRCCLWATSSASTAVLFSWANTVLLQGRHQDTGSPFTGTEVHQSGTGTKSKLYALIRKPPDNKHLFWELWLTWFALERKVVLKPHFTFHLFVTGDEAGQSVLSVSLRPAMVFLGMKL